MGGQRGGGRGGGRRGQGGLIEAGCDLERVVGCRLNGGWLLPSHGPGSYPAMALAGLTCLWHWSCLRGACSVYCRLGVVCTAGLV